MPRAASRRLAARRGRRAISTGRGILLSRCRPETAAAWARRGLGAVTIAPLEGWTVIMATGPARARYPYDDAVTTLAGRPVGVWMRPTLGFFHLGRQGVVTVHPATWRAVARWAIWTPRDGLVAPVGLPAARPEDLLAAAGAQTSPGHGWRADDPGSHAPTLERGDGPPEAQRVAALRAALRDGDTDALDVLRTVMDILAMPGHELLSGAADIAALPGARLLEPAPRHARAFDALVSEATRHDIELEV